MGFVPVSTLEELYTFPDADLREGYASADRNDPEPGDNRGKAFWHGWRCRMFDLGAIEIDEAHRVLTRAWVERNRASRPTTQNSAQETGKGGGDGAAYVFFHGP